MTRSASATSVSKLPDEILPVGSVAGTLTSAVAAELGIAGGPPVAVGGIDAHVSLLACGGSMDGVVSLVSGTSSAIIAEVDAPVLTTEVWGPVPAGAASLEVARRGWPDHQRLGAQVGGGNHHGRRP